jgi:hypothetical protein
MNVVERAFVKGAFTTPMNMETLGIVHCADEEKDQ